MKVLLAADWFLKLVVEGQAIALRELGHDVRLLCRDHADEFAGSTDERDRVLARLRAAGVQVTQLPGRRFGPEGLRAAVAARRELRRWRPDVVSAHENDDPRLLYAVRGFPLVYTVHDPEPHPGARVPSLKERLTSRAWLSAADCLVVHGCSLVPEMVKLRPGRPVRVVPHGIEVAERPLNRPDADTILLFGRMEPYKGVAVLAQAMERVWAQRPGAKLTVAGRGPSLADVPQDPRVETIGRYISEDEVLGLLARAAVVVLPYTQASQSGVGLLSIAHGVPAVVTDVGSLSELVSGSEFVVRAGNPESLAEALLRALDGGSELRREVLEHATAHFVWLQVARRYVAVYQETISGSIDQLEPESGVRAGVSVPRESR